MSDETEQIAKNPISVTSNREKDPKKVAAGKKLADYNRPRAKEALQRENQREAEPDIIRESSGPSSKPWIPELSFQTVLFLVAVAFTAFDLLMKYFKKFSKEPVR